MEPGARAAVEAVARERAVAAFEPQPALIELDDLGLDTPSVVAARRKAGRPVGARNRRAEDVARAVIEHLGDPLVMLASLAMTPVAVLVAAGLKPDAALEEKRLAAVAVLPYLHQRKPLAVDVTGRQVVHLTIGEIGGAGGEAVTLDAVEIVECQAVSGAADGPV